MTLPQTTLHHFTQNDIDQYHDFVVQHKEATPYHNKAWGEAVQKAYGFSPQYFGLKQDGKLTAVLPAVLMKTLKGKPLLCSLPYCDLGGILASSPEYAHDLKSKLVEYSSKQGFAFEYRDTLKPRSLSADAQIDSDKPAEVATPNIADGTKVRMIYQLLDDVDAQMKSFKPKLRSQIKKAVKNGVVGKVIASPSASDIDAFYEVFATNMRDLGSPVHGKDWFTQIFAHYQHNAFMVLVEIDNKCIGGGIVIHSQHKAVIPWASTLRSHNKLAPNMLLYWEVLAEVITRGIQDFDFGRSGFNEGTFRFKKQWGALPVPLIWESMVNNELVEESTSTKSAVREKIEDIWRKMPIPLTVAVGPKIRKFISL